MAELGLNSIDVFSDRLGDIARDLSSLSEGETDLPNSFQSIVDAQKALSA